MDPFPSVRNRQERAVECLTTGHCGAQPQLPKVRSLMGPCPGEGAGAGVGDITGWLGSLLSSVSSHTPRLRDSFKHSECASETHHLNRHIVIVVAVAAICGED